LLFARARRFRAFFAMAPVSQMTPRTRRGMSGHSTLEPDKEPL
jgi:hypothetical protein